MVRYQGEDIPFTISIKKMQASDADSWFVFKHVYVYFYTQTSKIAKFDCSFLENKKGIDKNGDTHQPFDSIDERKIAGTIHTGYSKLMHGALYMDILVRQDDNNNNIESIRRINTGIEILSTPIKIEAYD